MANGDGGPYLGRVVVPDVGARRPDQIVDCEVTFVTAPPEGVPIAFGCQPARVAQPLLAWKITDGTDTLHFQVRTLRPGAVFVMASGPGCTIDPAVLDVAEVDGTGIDQPMIEGIGKVCPYSPIPAGSDTTAYVDFTNAPQAPYTVIALGSSDTSQLWTVPSATVDVTGLRTNTFTVDTSLSLSNAYVTATGGTVAIQSGLVLASPVLSPQTA